MLECNMSNAKLANYRRALHVSCSRLVHGTVTQTFKSCFRIKWPFLLLYLVQTDLETDLETGV